MDTSTIVGIVIAAVVVIAAIVIAVVAGRRRAAKKAQEAAAAAAQKRASVEGASGTSKADRSAKATKGAAAQASAQKVKKPAAAKESAEKESAEKASADNTISESSGTSETEVETAEVAEAATSETPETEAAETEASGPASEAAAAPAPAEKPEGKQSRLTRLRARLSKSANPFGKALFAILTKDNLSETDWEDIEDTLILADVGTDASEQIVDELRADARVNSSKTPAEVRATLRRMLLEQVGEDTDRSLAAERDDARHPSVIIMVGVNGTGKTTTAGKLARLFVAEGKSVVLGAADTFRAAAADQLETWGSHVGVPVVRADHDGADPASVAFDAAQKAIDADADVLIIDTAGRLQNKANLMDELGKIRRVVEKKLPVDEVLLVLDATTGQNGMVQAKVFSEAIGVTGVALTKLDGSAKGGIVISVQKELGVPVKLVGLGEGPDDLAPFDPAGFVDGILGD
ncbi:signal recognition particle-docking protein FtsY [Pseudoscardovia radai]|uniref:Signal recognition particle receptor FtsY n=1 Tax=Pseudoscardovia radai TaxID=987066 RepID=A0A261EVA9_9BIFI|nr:signal recognition particle-docking protein FtsY [Pseudoscardovia radai]OZG50586.1 signal recognition particle-docking protein FtsY [Pseudoscardovia radai]